MPMIIPEIFTPQSKYQSEEEGQSRKIAPQLFPKW
jgi:hypothetical protein